MVVPVAALAVLGRLFPPPLHQGLVAVHAKDTLRCSCIFEIFDLLFAIPAFEACRTEGLISRQDCEILDLVPACAAAVCTIITYERPVAEEEQVCVRVEEGAARIAAEAVYVPSIASCQRLSISTSQSDHFVENIPSSKAFPSSSIYVNRRSLALGAEHGMGHR